MNKIQKKKSPKPKILDRSRNFDTKIATLHYQSEPKLSLVSL